MKLHRKVLARALTSVRENAGLTQVQLAERCQELGGRIGQTTVSLWETGDRQPRIETLLQVLGGLSTSLVDFEVHLQIFNRYPPDKPLEPLTDAELAALPELDRRMRQFVVAKPGSLRSRVLYHAIKGQVLMEAIGDESEKLTAYIEERFRTAEEAP